MERAAGVEKGGETEGRLLYIISMTDVCVLAGRGCAPLIN